MADRAEGDRDVAGERANIGALGDMGAQGDLADPLSREGERIRRLGSVLPSRSWGGVWRTLPLSKLR